MRYFLLLLFVVFARVSYGQTVDSVSKIIFEYSKGNAWGDTLKIGETEIVELSRVDRAHFKISRYLRIIHYGKPDWKKDTSELNSTSLSAISSSKIAYLLEQLCSNKDNFNMGFIRPKLRAPSNEDIEKIAWSDTATYWRFIDKDYLEKSERTKLIKKIQHYDKLDTFISLKRPSSQYINTVTTDTWDGLGIYVINNRKDTLKFTSFYHNLLGQPFNMLKKDVKTGFWRQVINLEINTSIEAILPKTSLLKRRIGIDSLTNEYISWYLIEIIK